MTPRMIVATLCAITALSWAVTAWQIYVGGLAGLDIMVAANALMFTAMLVVWPFLNGRRVRAKQIERAAMCRDCHAFSWPGELAFGFCIHCGSTKIAWPA